MVKKYSKRRNNKSKRRYSKRRYSKSKSRYNKRKYSKSKRKYSKSKGKYSRNKQKGGSVRAPPPEPLVALERMYKQLELYKDMHELMTDAKEWYMTELRSNSTKEALEKMEEKFTDMTDDQFYHFMYLHKLSPLDPPKNIIRAMGQAQRMIQMAILAINELPKIFPKLTGYLWKEGYHSVVGPLTECAYKLKEIAKFEGMKFPEEELAYSPPPVELDKAIHEYTKLSDFTVEFKQLGDIFSMYCYQIACSLLIYSYIATDSNGRPFVAVRENARKYHDDILESIKKVEALLNDKIDYGNGIQNILSFWKEEGVDDEKEDVTGPVAGESDLLKQEEMEGRGATDRRGAILPDSRDSNFLERFGELGRKINTDGI